jgi:diguanylate cyclase (GGDEF)-like protein
MSASGPTGLKPALDFRLLNTLRPAWIPAGILVGTALLALLVPLPTSLAGLRTAGPYALLITPLGMALRFNRGRVFVLLASLLGGFAAGQLFPVKAVYTMVAVLVPLNVLLAMIFPERGARYRMAYAWLTVFAFEGLLLFSLSGLTFDLSHLGRILFAAAFAAAVWRAWPDAAPLQVGSAGALAAFYIASEWTGSPGVHGAFISAAGAILVVSLLEESHRLAFRDPLTGLPGRRALEERLRSLGRRYAIAMVDVDHFKKFNDVHGHDIGDQVLKLVAARLAEVSGGGKTYRYGGEEFAVLFPGAELDDVLPHLEALRRSIQDYRIAVRSPDRPKASDDGAKRRGQGGSEKRLSVTVSIGASGPGEARPTPIQVIHAADEALYRAKQTGRNKVST